MSSDSPDEREPSTALVVIPGQSAVSAPVDDAMASDFDFGLVMIFGVVFVGLCALFAISMHRARSTPIAPVAQITFAPQDEAATTPLGQTALRAEAVSFWKPAIRQAGVADAMLRTAQSDFAAGSGANAGHAVTLGQRAADAAYQAALSNPPEDEAWSTIQSDLADGISIERDALAKAKAALQSNSPGGFGQAANASQNARKAIAIATRDARVWYIHHDGNAAVIVDIDGNPGPRPGTIRTSHR